MKKILIAILTLLYIVASLGFTLHKQYCTGSLSDRDLSNCISKICDKCGSEHFNQKDKNCCRNKNTFVKNDNDQNIPEEVFQLSPLTSAALPAFTEISFNKLASVAEANTFGHAPPPDSGIAIYIRDRVFRI
jgi:hypothetical protein